MVRRRSHPSHGLSTASRRSIARSVRAARPASCSVWLILKARMFLSLSAGFFLAFDSPWVAHSRSRCDLDLERARFASNTCRSAPGRVGPRWPAPRGRPPTLRRTGRVDGSARRSRHVGHGAAEELTVVAHDDDSGGQARQPGLQPSQAIEVEVVRRLVEQVDVVPAGQKRGHPGSGRLTSRERGGGLIEEAGGEAEARPDLVESLIEVGTTQAQPTIERLGVDVAGVGFAGGHRRGGGRHGRLGIGDPGAAGHELTHRLAGVPLTLLG